MRTGITFPFSYMHVLAGIYIALFLLMAACLVRKAFTPDDEKAYGYIPRQDTAKRAPFASLAIDLVYVLFLAIASIRVTNALAAIRDILPFDESLYLYHGVKLPEFGPPSVQERLISSPLYSIWYYILSLFESDTLRLYYLNYKVIVTSATMLLYFYMRRLKVAPLIAAVVSFIFLISANNGLRTPVWVVHFVLVVVLFFLILSTFIRSREWRYAVAGCGILLAMFVRPEYAVSFAFFSIVFSVFLIRRVLIERAPKAPALASFLSLLLVAIFVFCILGSPVSNRRSMFAFAQHFAIRYVAWNDIAAEPWTHCWQIASAVFGDAQTVMECAFNNPAMFFKSIIYNTWDYIPNFMHGSVMRLHYFLRPFPYFIIKFLQLILFLTSAIFLFKKRPHLRNISGLAVSRELYLAAGILSLPGLAVGLIIYPRHYYLIVQQAMLAIVLSYLVSHVIARIRPHRIRSVRVSLAAALCIGPLFVFLVPDIVTQRHIRHKEKSAQEGTDYTLLQMRATVEFLRSLEIDKDVVLLELDGGYKFYLGDNYTWVGTWVGQRDKKEPFYDFLATYDVNMIVVGYRLLISAGYADDKQMQEFLKQPEKSGFRRIEVPKTEKYLLVKEGLL